MSWWKERAQAVAQAARENPGMSADRLADRAEQLVKQRNNGSPAQTGGTYQNPVYSFRPANDARESKATSLVAGVVHDSFRLQPAGLPPNVVAPIVSWTDQYYEKVDQAEAVGRFRTLPPWQQQAWANAAQALGGGSRTAESTYARYAEMSGYLSARGLNKDPLDLLLEDTQTGYMPPNLFDRDAVLSSSSGSSGYRSYGGGGYGGGGGGGGGQVSLTNPTSARGLLMQTMQGVLGRNPTEQEYSQFVKALGQAEMGAPRTVGFEGDLAVQSGGIDPGMVAMEYVQGLDEFESAEGQRAFGAFMQVLGA
jgi:hypothetical protein